MADNVTIPATGSGTATPIVATDDEAGVHYQKVKLVDGASGSTAAIGGDATNGLDVDVTRSALPTGASTSALQTQPGVDIGDVTVNNAAGASAVNVQDGGNSLTIDAASLPLPTGASTLAEQQTQTTALQLIDDSVHTDDAARGKSLLMGAVLDDTAPTAITENQAGYLRMSSTRRLLVDGSGVTQPVSGTVSVTEPVSVDDNGGNLSVDWAGTVPPIGAGTEAAALRVTVATDSTGVLSVDDNAGTLTVDAPVGTPVAARLSDGAAFLTTTGGRLSVDGSGVTQPVSGTVTANLAAGTNTNEVVGDVAFDIAAAGNPVLVGSSKETMADSAPANRAGTDGDVERFSTADGALFVIPTGPQTFAFLGTGVQTDAQVHAAPGAGLSCYITSISFSIGAATASSIKVLNNAGADIWGPHYLEAVNGRGLHVTFLTPLKATANTRLDVTTTGAATQTVDINGFIAPG